MWKKPCIIFWKPQVHEKNISGGTMKVVAFNGSPQDRTI